MSIDLAFKTKSTSHRFRAYAFWLIALVFILTTFPSGYINAMSESQKEILLRKIYYYNAAACSALAPDTDTPQGGELEGAVYMVGDSITERANNDLKDAFQSKNVSAFINASVGRSVTGAGNTGDKTNGLRAVDDNKDRVKNASNVVVALGTNGLAEQDIKDMISAIKQHNNDAKIYWVNIFSTYSGAQQKERNKLIEDGASSESYTVIDTVGKVELEKDGPQPGLHETIGKGTKDFANAVLEGMSGKTPSSNPNVSSLARNCACQTSSSNIPGSNDQEKVWNFLSDPAKDLKPYQVAGIMGNMMAESGIEPQRLQNTPPGKKTPASAVPRVETGWGLVQWTPAHKFIDPAKADGKDPNKIEVQLDFLWTQLQGKGPEPEYPEILQQLRATPNIEEAVKAFQGNQKVGGPYIGFERPADQAGSVPERTEFAKDMLAKFGSSTPGDLSSGGPSCQDDGGSGAVIDGYSFPIWSPTQSDYGQPGASPLPCEGICHHDGTPALDLSSKFSKNGTSSEGAPVYAISDGKITVKYTDVRPTGAVCNSVTLTSSKDNHIYWYGHLKRDTSIKSGPVEAGKKVGNVGPNPCADNTLPHLHISRVPSSSSPDSMANRDKGLIPIINKLYEGLPK